MISYTLSEARAFYDQFHAYCSFLSKSLVMNTKAVPEWVVKLTDPSDIVERVLQNIFILEFERPPNVLPLPPVGLESYHKARMILLYYSLEELIPYINEPEPYNLFVEWRLKLGK